MEVKEPSIDYCPRSSRLEQPYTLETLKTKVIEAVDATSDEDLLLFCLNNLKNRQPIPCCYDDNLLRSEIQRSLNSGVASEEEVNQMYLKWGL